MLKESRIESSQKEIAAFKKDFDLMYPIKVACSFGGILSFTQSPDSELYYLSPTQAKYTIENYVDEVAGTELGSKQRAIILGRIAKIITPLGKVPWDTHLNAKKNVLKNMFGELDLKKQETSMNDIIGHFNEKVLERALNANPSLKERMLHIYSLVDTLEPLSCGVDKIIEFSTVGRKRVENETKIVKLFRKHNGDIPKDILESLEVENRSKDYSYDEINFDSDVQHLFLRNIYARRWKEARNIAKLASKTYIVLLQKLGKNNYNSEDSSLKNRIGYISTNYALWNWKVKNFNILKEDILFIKTGSRKELPHGYLPIPQAV